MYVRRTAVVSSPLTLSHDVNNDTVSALIWPIIANTEVLEVNRAYEGSSGGVYDSAETTVELTDAFIEATEGEARVLTPAHQFLAKPISGNRVAVLLMNSDGVAQTLAAVFADVPGVTCTKQCKVRDIWNHKDLGAFDGSVGVLVGSHDAAFLVIQN